MTWISRTNTFLIRTEFNHERMLCPFAFCMLPVRTWRQSFTNHIRGCKVYDIRAFYAFVRTCVHT